MLRFHSRLVGTAVLVMAVMIPLARADEVMGDFARGAKYYADNCGRCHKARAPSEHRDREWSIVVTHMRVAAGLPGQQARDVEAYLRASNNPPRPVAPVELATSALSGAQLLDSYGCRACHVIGGRGGVIAPELDSVFERRDLEWVRVQIQHPRQHNQSTVMPDFGFTDDQVATIIEVLRAAQ
ncbi:MAG: c-type cytochrome [Myxococcales bacterium]|nr:c-type cytochrome [Myxococcales bacterium]